LVFISQAETERILRQAIARQGVTPEWNTELVESWINRPNMVQFTA
jgi:hypothetical protein